MVKNLYVGDPHATVESIKDVCSVMDLALTRAIDARCDNLVVLGDLFHTHATVNVFVATFWLDWFKKASELASGRLGLKVIVGNHDIPGKERPENCNALKMLAPYVQVIDRPIAERGVEYRPYVHDREDFIALPSLAKTLVCHETFDGAQFDNGFYVNPENSVNPDLIEATNIVSGHIHRSAKLGKVLYTGSSRWVTESDANQQKWLWIVTHHEDGKLELVEDIPLSKVATPIFVLDIFEDDSSEINIDRYNGRIIVNLHGDSAWINEKAKQMAALKVEIRRFPKARKVGSISEAKGVSAAFQDLVRSFEYVGGTDRNDVENVLSKYLNTSA